MATNPYVNKVVYGNQTLIDISDTTATADKILQGYTAYGADGQKLTGTATGGGGSVTQDQDGFIVLPPDGGGGGGGDSWTWMGKNPTLVKSYVNEKVFLANSAFSTWTPTTTQTTLVSATNLETYTANLDYDYVLLYKWHTHLLYNTESIRNIVKDLYCASSYVTFGRSSDYTNFTNSTKNEFTYGSGGTMYAMVYIGSYGSETLANSGGYSVFPTFSVPSISSLSITPHTTNICARCSNSYFSTASASAVDQQSSYYEQSVDLYRVDSGTSSQGAHIDEIYDIVSNGI